MWTVLGSLGTKLVAYWAANSSKVIVMGVVTVTTLGIIGYGYYKIDQGGYNRADLEWKEREAKVNSQQDALLKQRQKEHDLALKQNSDMFLADSLIPSQVVKLFSVLLIVGLFSSMNLRMSFRVLFCSCKHLMIGTILSSFARLYWLCSSCNWSHLACLLSYFCSRSSILRLKYAFDSQWHC